MKRIVFRDQYGDGEGPWIVSIDGRVIIDHLRSKDMNPASPALDPLWAALGAEVIFEWIGGSSEIKGVKP